MLLRPIDIVMGVTVALVWGMGIVFAKAALEYFPPILLMAFRFAVAALVLVWFVKPPWAQMGRIFAVSLVAAGIQYSLTFNGLRGLDASTAVLILQLEVPFLVVLGALFLGETPGFRKWVGIAAAFAGVGLIVGAPHLGAAWGYIALLLSGAFMWAIGQCMVRRLREIDSWTLIAWVAVFAAPQLFVFSFVLEGDPRGFIASAGWIVWGTVVYLGLIMTALGYGLWYKLLARHPVSRVGPFLLLLPVFSVIGGVILLGERLSEQIALGGLIVIAGVAFILFERAPVPAAHPVEEAEP